MKSDIIFDMTLLPDHQQEYPWAKLQAWALANQPHEESFFKEAFWKQVMFVRDDLRRAMGNVTEITVVSTHTSKSILLPVYKLTLKSGVRIIMRGNFHDWKVTVISSELRENIQMNTALFDANKRISEVYCEGFEDIWVHGPYYESRKAFTLEAPNDLMLFAILMSITKPDPMVNRMASSLERTSNRLRSVLSSKTVRDADETLEEARHILAKTKRP